MRGFLIGEYSDQGLHCQLSLSGAIQDKDMECPTRRHAWKRRHFYLTDREKALNNFCVPT